MKIKLFSRLALAGCFATLFFVAPRAAETETLAFVERATTDAVIDVGADGDSAGDVLTFANYVYDETDATKVGTDNGWCIRTVLGRVWECFWTLVLADGQITVEGPFHDVGDSTLAVTGGTDRYVGAKGSLKMHPRNTKGTEYEFTYMLVK